MTLTEYAQEVQKMRALQKTYFRERDYNALDASKTAERHVDRLTKIVLTAHPLFPEESDANRSPHP